MKRLATIVAVCSLGFSASGQLLTDQDEDGRPDGIDNCVEVSNAIQVDSDLDAIGNACDPDYNNDGAVGIGDFNLLRRQFGLSSPNPAFNPAMDSDHNGAIGLSDFNMFRRYFGGPPGPSGYDADVDCDPMTPAEFESAPSNSWGDLLDHARSLGFVEVLLANTCGGSSADTAIVMGVLGRAQPSGAEDVIAFFYSGPQGVEILARATASGGTAIFDQTGGLFIASDRSVETAGPDGEPSPGGAGSSEGLNSLVSQGCGQCWTKYACNLNDYAGYAGLLAACGGAALACSQIPTLFCAPAVESCITAVAALSSADALISSNLCEQYTCDRCTYTTDCSDGAGQCFLARCLPGGPGTFRADPARCNDDNCLTADTCHPWRGCENVRTIDSAVCQGSTACESIEPVCNSSAYGNYSCQVTRVTNCNDANCLTSDICDPQIGCINFDECTRRYGAGCRTECVYPDVCAACACYCQGGH